MEDDIIKLICNHDFIFLDYFSPIEIVHVISRLSKRIRKSFHLCSVDAFSISIKETLSPYELNKSRILNDPGPFWRRFVKSFSMPGNGPHSIRPFTNTLMILMKEQFPNLEHINLSMTSLASSQTKSFNYFYRLFYLNISRCDQIQEIYLPQTLKKLDISGCYRITDLSTLPDGLEELRMGACLGVQDISRLKCILDLKVLDIRGCKNIKDISSLLLFRNLRVLIMNNCIGIKRLPDWSSYPNCKIIELDINGCVNLVDIGKGYCLPQHLRYLYMARCVKVDGLTLVHCQNLRILDVTGCRFIKNLSFLPLKLRYLEISGCYDISDINNLPMNLEGSLGLCNFRSLVEITKFPVNVKQLDLRCCSGIGVQLNASILPKTLEVLLLSYAERLSTIQGNLPDSLKKLMLYRCEKLQTLAMTKLPKRLRELNFSGCISISQLDLMRVLKMLPKKLQMLNLSFCNNLDDLAKLDCPNLKLLDITCCHRIETLGDLPPQLHTLNAFGCLSLNSLAGLPFEIKVLDISYCTSLLDLRDCLPLSIETINISGCNMEMIAQFQRMIEEKKTSTPRKENSRYYTTSFPPNVCCFP